MMRASVPLLLFMAVVRLPADTVVVTSGDRLHGTIAKVENGKLHLKTDYAGTIQIAWDKIAELQSDGRYQVQSETGKRIEGEIFRDGNRVAVVDEDVERPLADVEVVSMIRLEPDDDPPGFWRTLDGSGGLGYSFTRGNAEQTQTSVTGEADYRRENYQLQADLTSILARQEDAETTSRHALNARYDRYLTPRAFAFGVTGFERNDRQKLDLRSRFGGGFGWKVIKSRDTEFDLLGGATLTNEQFRNGEGEMVPRNSTGEGLFGFEAETTHFWGIKLSTRLTAHPNLVQTGRYRIEYDSSARIPLIAGFTWNVSLFDRYDSDPPRDGVLRNDYGLVSTFGVAF